MHFHFGVQWWLLGAARNSLSLLCLARKQSIEEQLAACDIMWLKKMLKDLGEHHDGKVVMFCDNMSSLQLASNPVYHSRTNT